MARPKKPESIKIKEGTHRQDRALPDALEKYQKTVKVILPPAHLSGYAQEYFLKISSDMAENQILTNGDIHLIESLSIKLAIQRQAYEEMGSDLIKKMTNNKGMKYEVINPLYDIINRQTADIVKICAQLGLSPESRTRIGVTKSKDNDPMQEFI